MGTMNKKVYLLEDDTSICELVQCALEMSGIELSAYNTVYEFWAALEKSAPSLALLDIMLPDGNGLEVLAKIKQKYPQVSCIMLSALGQETDKVRGLNLGADDYIAKPFGILELTARVNAALRRHGESAGIVRGDLALDEETMTATLRGVKLELNNKEFNLLKYLMQKEGKRFRAKISSTRSGGTTKAKRARWIITWRAFGSRHSTTSKRCSAWGINSFTGNNGEKLCSNAFC